MLVYFPRDPIKFPWDFCVVKLMPQFSYIFYKFLERNSLKSENYIFFKENPMKEIKIIYSTIYRESPNSADFG